LHPREKNVTVQAAIKAVQETQHELEWSFLEDSHHAGNWAAIMAYAVTDVNYWISVEEEKSVATSARCNQVWNGHSSALHKVAGGSQAALLAGAGNGL
jgi:hypothetical protein